MKNELLSDVKFQNQDVYTKNSLSRKAVMLILNKIKVGSLIIKEENEVFYFGQKPKDATICATISIDHVQTYKTILGHGSLGAGEAYMSGYWSTPDLTSLVRLMALNMPVIEGMDDKRSLARKFIGFLIYQFNRNSLAGSKQNISKHYDLSNSFFRLFLDKTMAYSSGIFKKETDTLEQASINKFEHICQKLQLNSNDHLLEVGTGWGGLAIYAAKNFGCKVTTTTISEEQYNYACDWVNREGLADKISVNNKDYRELDGKYDKLVSVEMIEAVGVKYYSEYFSKCSSLLKKNGLMLLQAITISDQRFASSVNNIDFINRYIFPGGQLPSNSVIANNVSESTDMQLINLDDLTLDYARTLKQWRIKFMASLDNVRQLGFDEQFIKMWHYYLCFCEGSFQERVIHTGQFLLAKPSFKNMPRIS